MADRAGQISAAAEHARLRRDYREFLPVPAGLEAHLRGVLEDVLGHPGSLIRAQVASGLLQGRAIDSLAARSIAIAVEYFHTASLLFDDLPCMDGALTRRGRPCPHRIWGEAAATLGALALINQGYTLLWRAFATIPPARARAAAALVADCLGPCGVIEGQARDLYFREPPGAAEPILAVAEGKTVALIRLALVLPGVVAGASEPALAALGVLARAWGLSYQIIDDFQDVRPAGLRTGQGPALDAAGRPNLPLSIGAPAALARLTGLLDEGRGALAVLHGQAGDWSVLDRLGELLDVQRAALARPTAARCA